jgi:hypothetical protein
MQGRLTHLQIPATNDSDRIIRWWIRNRSVPAPLFLKKGKALGFATPHNWELNNKSGDALISATRIEYHGGSCVEHSSTGNEIDILIELILIHYFHNTTCEKSKMNDC